MTLAWLSPLTSAKQTPASECGSPLALASMKSRVAADSLRRFDGSSVFSRRTGEDGAFSYPNLPAGRYRLTGETAGGSAAQEGVELRAREAGSGKPLRRIGVVEVLDEDRNGLSLQLRLDERGSGYIPSALAGSTLTFHGPNHTVKPVNRWDGQSLQLELEPNTTQAAQ